MKNWLNDILAADPTAPDEWLNRAAAIAVALAAALALYSSNATDRHPAGDTRGFSSPDIVESIPSNPGIYAGHP